MRYFREKLQRRNVTTDVKHYEDCEQLFLMPGKCFTVEALVQFFGMENKDGHITRNRPPYYILDEGNNKRQYYDSVLDKFIDQFLITPPINDHEESSQDLVNNYSVCLLKYYFLFIDFKDAVKEGNGVRLGTLHKELLLHFRALPRFNNYAIAMLNSIV